jgi:hypothetical protein
MFNIGTRYSLKVKAKYVGFAIIIVMGLILSECSSADRDESGQITKSGDVSAFDIQVGDCFKDLPEGDSYAFSSVSAVPCNEAHQWQAYHSGSISLTSYSTEAAAAQAEPVCSNAAEELFINMSSIKFDAFRNTGLTYIYPTYKSWTSRGDRSVVCLLGSVVDTYFTSVFE